jgi:ABC-type enterochelin transport system permease subunit
MIFTGGLSLLTLVHLRQGLGTAAGLDRDSLVTTGASLVSIYNGTLLLGQTLMPCLSAVLLGTLMYRSGLVPRAIPLVGLIGAPLLITSTIAAFFGVIPQLSAWSAIATLPVALWELSLGLWLTFKGFKPSPITAGMTAARTPPTHREAVPA